MAVARLRGGVVGVRSAVGSAKAKATATQIHSAQSASGAVRRNIVEQILILVLIREYECSISVHQAERQEVLLTPRFKIPCKNQIPRNRMRGWGMKDLYLILGLGRAGLGLAIFRGFEFKIVQVTVNLCPNHLKRKV